MKVLWKIFGVANIAEALLVTALSALTIFRGQLSFNNAEDLEFGSTLCIISVIITAICINNILLLRFFQREVRLPVFKKIIFWISALLMLSFSMVLISGIVEILTDLLDRQKAGIETRSEKWPLITLLWCIIMTITGLFIFIMQLLLFFRIQKSIKENRFDAVDGIGNSSV